MPKKKILFVNEASYLLTGYGIYGKQLLERLYATDKYEVAEFASYASIGDQRDKDIKWRFYPNAVGGNDPRVDNYNSQPQNQWGAWRFESVLLDFKPDIVMAIRDPWMDSFLITSPLRPFYNLVLMPTVDSAPQRPSWIEDFISLDGVMTYSDWSRKVLEKEGGGKINTQQATYTGVDLNVHKPVKDKKEHRKKLGFEEDAFIIGTVMRNQKRKLFPELFKAFRKYLDNVEPELANKTYLYVHTSYPDMQGWDLPGLLLENDIGHKVLFTYLCKATSKPFISFFQDAKTYSPYSNGASAIMPTVGDGLSTEAMVDVINVFDLYVQYAITEGLGVPAIEAAACGIPIATVNYSAMIDTARLTGGYSIKLKKTFRELETNANRVYPDNDHLAEIMEEFFRLSPEERQAKSDEARLASEKHFNFDNISKIWEKYFDAVTPTGLQGKWNHPMISRPYPQEIPKATDKLTNHEFVKWLFNSVMNEPGKVDGFKALEFLKKLNFGITTDGGKINPFTRKDAFNICISIAKNKEFAENLRCGTISLGEQDYIKYAHEKEKKNGK